MELQQLGNTVLEIGFLEPPKENKESEPVSHLGSSGSDYIICVLCAL